MSEGSLIEAKRPPIKWAYWGFKGKSRVYKKKYFLKIFIPFLSYTLIFIKSHYNSFVIVCYYQFSVQSYV